MPDLLTTDIAMLCRALDEGDDSALPILADALEEAGLPRAKPNETWTRSVRGSYWTWPKRWAWYTHGDPVARAVCPDAQVPRAIYLRLRGRTRSGKKCYPTRSAAYLALAEALICR